MTPDEITAEVAALRSEQAQLEAVIRAPQRLSEVATRMRQLEQAAERAEARALADEIAPGWRDQLAAAEAAFAEADLGFRVQQSAVLARERKAQRIADKRPGSSGMVVDMVGTVLIDRRATTELNIADERRRAALARVARLRALPAALAAEAERDRRPGPRVAER